jgi:hypothetical protein
MVERTAVSKFGLARAELAAAGGALLFAFLVAGILLTSGGVRLRSSNAASFLDSVFLGSVLALVGAWLDVRLRQPLGVLLLALAALLSLDGAIATYFAGLPMFALIAASFVASLLRRRRQGGPEA